MKRYKHRGESKVLAPLLDFDVGRPLEMKADVLLRKYESIQQLVLAYGYRLTDEQRESVFLLLDLFYYVSLCGLCHVYLRDIHFYNTMWDGLELQKRNYTGADLDGHDKRIEKYNMPRSLDDYQPENGVWHPPMKQHGTKPIVRKTTRRNGTGKHYWGEIEELDELLKQYYQSQKPFQDETYENQAVRLWTHLESPVRDVARVPTRRQEMAQMECYIWSNNWTGIHNAQALYGRDAARDASSTSDRR